MPVEQRLTDLAASVQVRVDGAEPPPGFAVVRITVDENLHAPAVCLLEMVDVAMKVSPVPFEPGARVSVTASVDGADQADLFTGEVTGVDVEMDATAVRVVLRCYDAGHRLQRRTTTRTWLQTTISDVVRAVAAGYPSMRLGRIDGTGVVYPQLSQVNVDDWTFLQHLAGRVGWVCALERGALGFHPVEPGGRSATLEIDRWQTTVHRFRATLSGSQQVADVKVRGWDEAMQRPVTAAADATTPSASHGTDPATLAGAFGSGSVVHSSAATATIEQAKAIATGLARRVAGTFAEVEAEVPGDPRWRVGAALALHGFGRPIDGTIVVTATYHQWDEFDGYVTRVTASDGRDRTLLGLTASGASVGERANRIDGLVPAVVCDANDPDRLGRVKVKLPWLDDALETGWARTVQVGAGGGYGTRFVPKADDEVLVGFEDGDVGRPYVIGGLYSAKNRPFDTKADAKGGNDDNQLAMVSRSGQRIVFSDADGDRGVRIIDGSGSTKLTVGGPDGGFTVETSKPVTIKTSDSMRLEATNDLVIKGRTITIEADTTLSMKGGTEAVLEGGTTAVRAKAQLELEASGPASLKGAIVEIN